ncbi:class I SAM-dependent methyltransferase [Methylomonas fluvii]|uniref:Methyltransferase domain-containing protein n=1 Tax=Methylomonas fluvii TaxID=1854564 RepID=A0ABR9DE68_9GAMM|nr:methyltransferase domain-containing protein [Methylomonas fluvii]MBD9361076.1 methyltransferase domain-containing protein [Methylomonas fluvii]
MYWRIEKLKHSIMSFSLELAIKLRAILWKIKEKNYPKSKDGKILFHIGCGDINSPEFINIDARKDKHVHIVTHNISRLWMIPSDTADLIYMCHILEHVPRYHVATVLKEMYRILKPNGKLRLSVPDFDCIVAIYQDTNNDIQLISPPLMGGQDYPENFHFEVYNKSHLEKTLQLNGFCNILPWDPNKVEHHNFNDWASKTITISDKEYVISLNLEASKIA